MGWMDGHWLDRQMLDALGLRLSESGGPYGVRVAFYSVKYADGNGEI